MSAAPRTGERCKADFVRCVMMIMPHMCLLASVASGLLWLNTTGISHAMQVIPLDMPYGMRHKLTYTSDRPSPTRA